MRALLASAAFVSLLAAVGGCGLVPVSLDCKWSLTGAVTASGSCEATTVYKASLMQSEVAIVPTVAGSDLDAVGITIAGMPSASTFTSTAGGSVKGGATMQILQQGSITSQWLASFGNSGTTDQGSYKMTLTSAAAGIASSGGDQFWTTHGTITATAPPSPAMPNAATGTANLSVTF